MSEALLSVELVHNKLIYYPRQCLEKASNKPSFATSQGNLIVSPATNLNVSERDIKLGSGLLM